MEDIRVISDFVVEEVDNEGILLNLDTEMYYTLNFVGLQMWNVLSRTKSTEQCVEELLEMFDVAEETLREDLDEFIDRLIEMKLIERITAK